MTFSSSSALLRGRSVWIKGVDSNTLVSILFHDPVNLCFGIAIVDGKAICRHGGLKKRYDGKLKRG